MNTSSLSKIRIDVERFEKQIETQKNNPHVSAVKQQLAQLKSDIEKAGQAAASQQAVVIKNLEDAFLKIQSQYRKIDPKIEKITPGKPTS